jgi:hypothetical protein
MRMGLRLVSLFSGLIGLVAAGNVWAGAADTLAEVLRIDEMIEVLHDEGRSFGGDLDRDMLGGRGGAHWADQIARVYDQDRMARHVRDALRDGMTDVQIADTLAFYETKRGQRILTLETSARRAMSDPEVEQIARETYDALKGSDDARLANVARFVDVNDLLERNVAGSLSSNFQFMRGLVDGGASDLSDGEITADVWAQEDETRKDTESWLFGYLLLAYRPLGDDDLEAYIDYSETPAGQALNAALFDGFDGMYLGISHALGVLVAEASFSSEL